MGVTKWADKGKRRSAKRTSGMAMPNSKFRYLLVALGLGLEKLTVRGKERDYRRSEKISATMHAPAARSLRQTSDDSRSDQGNLRCARSRNISENMMAESPIRLSVKLTSSCGAHTLYMQQPIF